MRSYNIIKDGNVLKLSFGAPAQNDEIVRDAVAAMESLDLTGGGQILLNGPASLPVAVAIAHGLSHKFSSIGVFDPKINRYVVAVSHDPGASVGDLV